MSQEISYYKSALENFIDYSTNDVTSSIAREHCYIGLSRLFSCMDSLGMDYNETKLVALPDFTYTRNPARWDAGFPYGCIMTLNQNNPPFIPLDFRPNCCGIIFAEIPYSDYDISMIQKKYYEIINSYKEIDNKDFNRRNHFLGLYRDDSSHKCYFLIHGSFKFVKRQLYSEHNNELLSKVRIHESDLGQFRYLLGDNAISYYNNYMDFEELTFKYRDIILNELFPKAKTIFQKTHEGFLDMQTILLGAYAENTPFECPIMLAPECDLCLIDVNQSIAISETKKLYCAPHGGGYALSTISDAIPFGAKENNEYLITFPNGSQMLTNNVLDMPFYYRTNTAYEWCENYQMGKVINSISPILNLKV